MRRENFELDVDGYLFNADEPTELLDWMGYAVDEEENPIVKKGVVEDAFLTRESNRILSALKEDEHPLFDRWSEVFHFIREGLLQDDISEMISDLHTQTEEIRDSFGISKKTRR